jgi:hypothetical protein
VPIWIILAIDSVVKKSDHELMKQLYSLEGEIPYQPVDIPAEQGTGTGTGTCTTNSIRNSFWLLCHDSQVRSGARVGVSKSGFRVSAGHINQRLNIKWRATSQRATVVKDYLQILISHPVCSSQTHSSLHQCMLTVPGSAFTKSRRRIFRHLPLGIEIYVQSLWCKDYWGRVI